MRPASARRHRCSLPSGVRAVDPAAPAGRRLWLAVLAVALVAVTGCGSGDERRGADPARLVTETVGSGVQTTTIIRPGGESPRPVVLFLHGWGATRPESYRPWLEHLARGGNVVLYPRYQESVLEPPAEVLGNLVAGVRLALGRLEERPRSLVVAGHSAGGALASDYAAVARSVGLPAATAVFAAYPGRSLADVPFSIPEIDPSRIDPRTRILALAGARDTVVGDAAARAIVRGATRVPAGNKRYEVIRRPAVADHLAPQRAERASRQTFWTRLDALMAAARRG